MSSWANIMENDEKLNGEVQESPQQVSVANIGKKLRDEICQKLRAELMPGVLKELREELRAELRAELMPVVLANLREELLAGVCIEPVGTNQNSSVKKLPPFKKKHPTPSESQTIDVRRRPPRNKHSKWKQMSKQMPQQMPQQIPPATKTVFPVDHIPKQNQSKVGTTTSLYWFWFIIIGGKQVSDYTQFPDCSWYKCDDDEFPINWITWVDSNYSYYKSHWGSKYVHRTPRVYGNEECAHPSAWEHIYTNGKQYNWKMPVFPDLHAFLKHVSDGFPVIQGK
jgi:hypothetical protein